MSWQTAYQSAQGCVSWQGDCAPAGEQLNGFLQGPVAARLNDAEGSVALTEHLRGLGLTGMGQEALAAVLEAHHDVVLPWNSERDKRNPFASLPGADIVGFQRDGDSHCLALGEVKCSSEAKWPPQVMSGRSGMIHQLDTLASNLSTICQLLKWLLPRVKNTAHEAAFDAACTRYFNSGNRDLALFGILVRDREAREEDLQARGRALAGRLRTPTRCCLIALYLPWPLARLPEFVGPGGRA